MSQIVCISRGSMARGKELAETLANRLDYALLSREDLIEAAIEEGIQVGKLETSLMKPQSFNQRLARERDHYLAFSTTYLCDKLREGPLVYHGRTGHLLLRDVSHVLRVRVVADEEYRVQATMQRLGLPREKALRYLTEVEEDRRSWVRSMYGVSWEDASQYDVVVKVERMNVQNAAAALVGMAQLPDFQMTPASRRAMEDLRLSARARLALARDPRTAGCPFSVGAHDGVVTITYLPHDFGVAEHVKPALAGMEGMEGIQGVRTTMAATTILWVQEAFDPESATFAEVTEIARKWNAAVELVRYAPEEEIAAGEETPPPPPSIEGGIEEDLEQSGDDPGGLKATLDSLARFGKAGGGRTVCGERRNLVTACCGAVPHSLVVVGNVFLGRDPAVRTRLTREMRDAISERMRVPVVTTDELRTHYLFGPRDGAMLAVWVVFVAALYAWVFLHQNAVLGYLTDGWEPAGPLAMYVVAFAVFLFVPVVAFSYGSVARLLMKLIKME